MYKQFFGLIRNPFEISPDPFFYHPTPRHNEALANLHYGVGRRKGFIVITGEVGTGKTLLVRCLLAELRKSNIAFGYVFNPLLTTMEFFQYIMADLGLPYAGRSKTEVLLDLNRFLIQRHARGLNTALVIDEAQALKPELLEEIRKLHSQRRLGCPYLFHRNGEPIKDFRWAWDSACIKAGLFKVVRDGQGNEMKVPTKLFHDFRRTAIRDMVRSGTPEKVAMEISGHKTRSVFDRYNIVSDQDLREAAKRKKTYHEKQDSAVEISKRGEVIPFEQARGMMN